MFSGARIQTKVHKEGEKKFFDLQSADKLLCLSRNKHMVTQLHCSLTAAHDNVIKYGRERKEEKKK